MKKLALAGFLLGMFGLITTVQAADKDDPTGTWKWKTKFNDKEFERTLKLELKDGKLTGSMAGFGGKGKDTPIEDAKFKDGEVSFSTKGGKGGTSVTKYNGKVSGDTIKGTVTRDVDGKETKTDWEAKREAKKD
jgi:hypothetical protein